MEKKIKIRLQGHEKFPLREGWLNKGILAVQNSNDVFISKEGPDILGIGNNMVKSVRYWMKAFGLIYEIQGKGAFLTPIGELIAKYDLYFEDSFTLWILHSNIAKNIDEATSWYMYFNKCDANELEKDQIVKILYREIKIYSEGLTFSDKSLKSDVDVLLNMYSKNKEKVDPEDKNTSPFSYLQLVKNNDGHYSKIHPDRRLVNEWNALFELAVMMRNENQLSIDKFINGDCGFLNIYQVTNVVANELLDKLDAMEYIRVDRTAGLDMIYRVKDFTPEEIINSYFTR